MRETSIREYASAIRSKQAGPFRLTFDIIFKDDRSYHLVKDSRALSKEGIAHLYGVPNDTITDFEFYDPGRALKITMIRPNPSGGIGDGDAYGCQQHVPLLQLKVRIDDSE